jgi:anaerobic dimethyl sulfoxide reductase subunit B (iron-sulfur subunit)
MNTDSQLGFYIDAASCIGCKTCQIVCRDKNNTQAGESWRNISEITEGKWLEQNKLQVPVGVFAYYLSISCQHCAKPLCMQECPSGAIYKDDNGIVKVYSDKCTGSETCVYVCPYGAPKINELTRKMGKCDMCADLRAENLNPACIDACPMRALRWGKLSDLKEKFGSLSSAGNLPDENITLPSLVINPHPASLK